MPKNCIISFANNRGNYIKGLERLGQSLKGRFDGDFIPFYGEESIGAPLHLENPYAFKIYGFLHALERGYTNILWLDSSVYAINDCEFIFDIIENEGYIMQEAGAYIGEWTNDNALNYFGVSRDSAMPMLMYGNAGFLGLSFRSDIAVQFFSQWRRSMLDGMFKGAWNNNNQTESQDPRCKGHRHDMSCGSIMANQLGMKYKSGNDYLNYAAPNETPRNETVIFFAQGL